MSYTVLWAIENEKAMLARARVLLLIVAEKVQNGIGRKPLKESTLKDLAEIEQLVIELQIAKGR